MDAWSLAKTWSGGLICRYGALQLKNSITRQLRKHINGRWALITFPDHANW